MACDLGRRRSRVKLGQVARWSCRLPLTDADREMRPIHRVVQSHGCTISIDRLGNIFARREGSGETTGARR